MKRILYLLLACFFLAASIAYAADIRWRNSKTALDSISGLQSGERGIVIGDNGTSQFYRYDGSKWVETPVANAENWATARLIAGNSVDGSENAPFANKFIVQGTADAGLIGAQFLGALGTGLVKNTTDTGILSIALAGADYAPVTSGTGILKGDGEGGFDNATYTDVVGLWATCAGYLKHDGTCDTPAGGGDNETLVNRLVDADHADNNATNSETRSDASVTPAALAYWSQNALTTRLMAWLADGTITGLSIGDGNFTVDASGNVTAKSYGTTRGDAAQYIELYEATSDGNDKATIAVPAKGTGLAGDVSITVSQSLSFTGTMNDGKYCTYASSGNVIACNSTPAGTGDFLADGSVPMTDGIVLADGNGDAPTTDGEMKYDRTAEKLQVGDGAATKEFVPVGVSSMITKYQYLPAAWMEDNATSPCAAAAVISGEETKARLCDDNESVIVGWQVDPEWTAGFKYRVYYGVVANAEENDTVTWRLAGCSVGNQDALTCTAGDQVSISDELGTDDDANELEITAWSDAVTITNLAAGEWARLTLMRGTDDEATEVNLIGIEIKYQAKISASSDY